jgi:hypothetical protein
MESLFVLTGAGASPGISTQFLTDRLLEWRGVLEPAGKNGGAKTPDETRRPFYKWLVDVSAEVYAPPPPGPFGYYPSVRQPNFEDLLYTVERLAYLMQWHFYDSPYQRPPPYEMPFFERSQLGNLLHDGLQGSLYDLVVWGSNLVLDTVAECAASHPQSDAGNLITALRKDGRLLKVFSLNYDSRVIDLSYDWWTGFRTIGEVEARVHDTKAGVQIFEPAAEIPENANAFVQLHGSTHFGWVAHPYRAPRYIVCRYPQQIMEHGTPRRGGFEYLNDRTALPALTIITGYRKAEKALIEHTTSRRNAGWHRRASRTVRPE